MMQINGKKLQKCTALALSFLLLLGTLAGCGDRAAGSAEVGSTNTYTPPVNEEGYIVITIPDTLLGGNTAEELEKKDRADNEGLSEEEISRLAWSKLLANEDGSFSYYFTPEQYERSKKDFYQLGRLRDAESGEILYSFVKDAEYHDIDDKGIPWGITVFADRDAYYSQEVINGMKAIIGPSMILARYQILCGVPEDEWSVHIILKDADTHSVLEDITYGEPGI